MPNPIAARTSPPMRMIHAAGVGAPGVSMVRNVPGCSVTCVVENPTMTSSNPITASTSPMMSSFVPGRLFVVAVFSVMPPIIGHGTVF